ncbi:MAG: aminotransferase class V-fold PLP-dependent enzyme [Clostridia bacterium]|nr:aminotransferase class V-fold PLP-dependent enzyme [Clostridia bacterium]
MIYLDNAATSYPKPKNVIQTMSSVMEKICANPGRSGHNMSIASGSIVSSTRGMIAKLINAPAPENIVFTQNCTEALNLAIKGSLRPGMHVVTTLIEHNSVLRVLKTLEQRGFIRLTVVAPDPNGLVDPEAVMAAVNKRTKLIVMTHASNVLGTVQPIEKIGAYTRNKDIAFLVDAAQSIGILPIDVQRYGIDMLAAPGHKALYGPQGTGFLYISPRLTLNTLKEGGTGTSSQSLYQPMEIPERYESGTLNTPGIAGLFCGVRYVMKNQKRLMEHERELIKYAISSLSKIEGLKLYGSLDTSKKVGVLSFNAGNYQSGQVADHLNEAGIAVRAGLHCAPGVHDFFGTMEQGMVRISVGSFNTVSDIDLLVSSVRNFVG